jgi:hypothetical protein
VDNHLIAIVGRSESRLFAELRALHNILKHVYSMSHSILALISALSAYLIVVLLASAFFARFVERPGTSAKLDKKTHATYTTLTHPACLNDMWIAYVSNCLIMTARRGMSVLYLSEALV